MNRLDPVTIKRPGFPAGAARQGTIDFLPNNCSSCAIRHICMPAGLSDADFAKLDTMNFAVKKLYRGAALYRTGDSFRCIYSIKAGSFKTVVVLNDGREQITGFQLQGDPLGMDGVGAERHSCDAIALEDSMVCLIPMNKLEQLYREVKVMQSHVYRWLCAEIVREATMITLLGSMSADERVSSFLVNISQRMDARGLSPIDLKLHMTREEIGRYLGLQVETVSRVLSRFQSENRIGVHGKTIRIVDMGRLLQL